MNFIPQSKFQLLHATLILSFGQERLSVDVAKTKGRDFLQDFTKPGNRIRFVM